MTTYTLNQLQLDGLILNCGSAVGKEMLRNLQPNTQEPSAWMQTDCIGERFLLFDEPYQPSPLKDKVDPLFTHQAAQRTQWQDLTVQEQAEATSKFGHVWSIDMIGIADAIGVKLREKNGHSHQAHGVKP